jgi:hypothetical protein
VAKPSTTKKVKKVKAEKSEPASCTTCMTVLDSVYTTVATAIISAGEGGVGWGGEDDAIVGGAIETACNDERISGPRQRAACRDGLLFQVRRVTRSHKPQATRDVGVRS